MTCDNCKKENKEVAIFTKKILGWFKVKVQVCQSCVPSTFKSFMKNY